jgi:hypothetical protein
VFLRLQTQWQVGMAGPIGLRYEPLAFALEIEGVSRADWPATVDAVQSLEFETLRLYRESRPQQ